VDRQQGKGVNSKEKAAGKSQQANGNRQRATGKADEIPALPVPGRYRRMATR
jgi:hypothetical protein